MKPNRLANLRRDVGYRWQDDEDPDLTETRHMIERSGLTTAEIIKKIYEESDHRVNLHYSTIDRIMNGKTKRPRNWTILWIAYALGYHREWVRLISERPRGTRH